MSLYRWNAINADGEIVCTVVTSVNDRAIARDKIVFKTGYDSPFFKIVKARSKSKKSNLGCDVELGGIGTNLKSVSTIMMIGGVGYLVYRFKLFKGLKWLTDAAKDLIAAPKTISVFEDEQLNVRGSQIEKMFNVLRQKADNFTTQYGKLYNEWLKLKNEIKTGAEGYGKTFYESGKMQYFGAKSSKEKMTDRLDSLRTKVLTEVRNLQNKKGFKVKGDWTIINGLNCFPFC